MEYKKMIEEHSGYQVIYYTEKDLLRMTLIQKLRYILILKRIKVIRNELRKFSINQKEFCNAVNEQLVPAIKEAISSMNNFSLLLSKVKFRKPRIRFQIRKRGKSGLV
jgi:hypothetical protein